MKGLLHNLYNQAGDYQTKNKVQEITHSIIKNAVNAVMALSAIHKISNLESLNNFKNEALLEEKMMNFRNTLISKGAQDHMLIVNLLEKAKLGIGGSHEAKIFRNEIDGIGALIRSNWEKRFIDLDFLRDAVSDILKILDPNSPSLPRYQANTPIKPSHRSPISSINHTVLQNTLLEGEKSTHKTPRKSVTKYYMIDETGNRIEIDRPETALNNKSLISQNPSFNPTSLNQISIPHTMRTPTNKRNYPNQNPSFQNQSFTTRNDMRTPTRKDNLLTIASPYKSQLPLQQHSMMAPLEISNLNMQTPQQPHVSSVTRFTGPDGTTVKVETSQTAAMNQGLPSMMPSFDQAGFNTSTMTIPKQNGDLFRMINDAKEDFSKPIVEFFGTRNCKFYFFPYFFIFLTYFSSFKS